MKCFRALSFAAITICIFPVCTSNYGDVAASSRSTDLGSHVLDKTLNADNAQSYGEFLERRYKVSPSSGFGVEIV